ncbi:MAG TPA: TIR domain-containing protein [Pyrinomonadaceae bacterium]|jgi:hypothetical protein
MSFLPDYSNDIFISYAHNDNLPLPGTQQGWIDTFHQWLEQRLTVYLGARPAIWRDPKLQGNDFFADELKERVPRVAVLISVFSKSYVNSEWCKREVQWFFEVAQQQGGIRQNNKARIFKIIKNPVPLDTHPPEIRDMTGYQFYYNEEQSGRPRELSDLGPQAIRFYQRVEDVAQDISQLLEELRDGAAQQTGTTVYLARTTHDLSEQYDSVRRELQARGHLVLPDRELPDYGPEFVRAVREDLQRAKLSVHLVGAHYGLVPEAADRSVVQLQNELAAERSAEDDSFQRLIWIPERVEIKEDRQAAYVELLENDPDAQRGADVMRSTLEDFKTYVQDKLEVILRPPAQPAAHAAPQAAAVAADTGPPRVYLICDRADYDAVAPLEDFLFEQGCEVVLPLMEGDEADVRRDHEQNLVACDAAVIYYGTPGEPWLRTKQADLQKAAGLGRTRPMRAKAVYVAGPETPQKQRFRTHEALVVRNFGDFAPEGLQPFVNTVKEARGK